jgi:hypothetical protein
MLRSRPRVEHYPPAHHHVAQQPGQEYAEQHPGGDHPAGGTRVADMEPRPYVFGDSVEPDVRLSSTLPSTSTNPASQAIQNAV